MQIPEQIKKLTDSTTFFDAIEKIGEKFSLHIDQIGELEAEIKDIMLGFNKSEDFQKHIMERLEINENKANEIIREVNVQIFDAFKKTLQNDQVTDSQSIKSIENAGGFSIVNGSNIPDNLPTDTEDRASILSGIENPIPNKETFAQKSKEDVHKEPLVDQLLQNTTSRPMQNSEIEPPSTQKTLPNKENEPQKSKPTEQRPIGIDPYKEPIK